MCSVFNKCSFTFYDIVLAAKCIHEKDTKRGIDIERCFVDGGLLPMSTEYNRRCTEQMNQLAKRNGMEFKNNSIILLA